MKDGTYRLRVPRASTYALGNGSFVAVRIKALDLRQTPQRTTVDSCTRPASMTARQLLCPHHVHESRLQASAGRHVHALSLFLNTEWF